MSAAAIAARLHEAAAGVSLAPSRRLDTKLDLCAQAIARRLRRVSELRDLCRTLERRRLGPG